MSSTVEGKTTSSIVFEQTEQPEWLIPKQQQQLHSDEISTNNDISTNDDITESLFSAGKKSNTVTSKAPLIVDLTDALDSGDTSGMAQGSTLSELILPLEITPSSSSKTVGRRPLIEEIDDDVSDNHKAFLTEEVPANLLITEHLSITEHNVNKAASFYSTSNKEPESGPIEYGGQWAERTQPLIEEVGSENVSKTDMVKVEAIEDLEDVEIPQLGSAGDKPGSSEISRPVDESKSETKVGGEGGTNRIAELAEKAGSTLDPVTVDQALLDSLRQKYQ